MTEAELAYKQFRRARRNFYVALVFFLAVTAYNIFRCAQ